MYKQPLLVKSLRMHEFPTAFFFNMSKAPWHRKTIRAHLNSSQALQWAYQYPEDCEYVFPLIERDEDLVRFAVRYETYQEDVFSRLKTQKGLCEFGLTFPKFQARVSVRLTDPYWIYIWNRRSDFQIP